MYQFSIRPNNVEIYFVMFYVSLCTLKKRSFLHGMLELNAFEKRVFYLHNYIEVTSFMRHSRPVHSAILLAPIVNHHTSIVYCYRSFLTATLLSSPAPVSLLHRVAADAKTFLYSFLLYFVYVSKAIVFAVSKILNKNFIVIFVLLF